MACHRRGGESERSRNRHLEVPCNYDHTIRTALQGVDDPYGDPRTVCEDDTVDESGVEDPNHPEVLAQHLRPSPREPKGCGVWSHQEDILMLEARALSKGALSRLPRALWRVHVAVVFGGQHERSVTLRTQTSPRVSALGARQPVRRPLLRPRCAHGDQVDLTRVQTSVNLLSYMCVSLIENSFTS